MSDDEKKFMMLEADVVAKIAKEADNLPNQIGHNQSFSRGYLEALEWVADQIAAQRSGEEK